MTGMDYLWGKLSGTWCSSISTDWKNSSLIKCRDKNKKRNIGCLWLTSEKQDCVPMVTRLENIGMKL